jgi:hypothetical protein
MATAVTVTKGNGALGNVVDWTIKQEATPTTMGRSAAVGDFALTTYTVTKSEFLDGNGVQLTDPDFGTFNGTVDGLRNGPVTDGSGTTRISAFGLMGQLNVDKVAPAIYGGQTLSDAYTTYIGLCFSVAPVISYTASVNPVVVYPAWSGNVWDMLNNMAAVTKTELAVVNGIITVRDINTTVLNIESVADSGIDRIVESNDIALTVELEAQNSVGVPDLGDFIYNYDTNPSLETNATNWAASYEVGTPLSAFSRSTTLVPATNGGTFSYSGTGTSVVPFFSTNKWLSTSGKKTFVVTNWAEGEGKYVSMGAKVASASTTGSNFQNALGIVVVWFDAANVLVGPPVYLSSSSIAYNTWVRASTYAVRPIGAAYGIAEAFLDSTWDGSVAGFPTARHGYDAVMISDSPMDFADGNTAGWAWEATTNLSRSRKANPNNTEFYSAYTDGNNIITADAGAEIDVLVNAMGTPDRLQQPLQTVGTPTTGQYMVIDSNGVIISPTDFNNSGGIVYPSLVADTPGIINIYFRAPLAAISGTVSPYSLAQVVQGQRFGALSIFGAGVKTVPEIVSLRTGADPARTQKEVGATFTGTSAIPFLETTGKARDRGSELAAYYAGGRVGVQFNLPPAAIDGLGLTEGSLVKWRYNIYRVTGVSVSPDGVQITADSRVMGSDFDAVWTGASGTTFSAFWATYTGNDFSVVPLWR